MNLKRRDFIKTASGSALALAVPNVVNCMPRKDNEKTNIIFFIADDMGYDMFNFLNPGTNLTPHIDQLAAEGVIMMKQYVTSPVCTPSRYSCLTGKYASKARNESFLKDKPVNEGMKPVTWNTHIIPTDMTLPKLMQSAGYVTGAVGKNHVIEAKEIKPKAEDDPKDPNVLKKLNQTRKNVKEAYLKCGFDYAESIFPRNADALTPKEIAVHNMDWVTKGALDFLDQNINNPFFLYFASTVTHSPSGKKTSWDADPLKTPYGYLENKPDVMPPRHTIEERLEKANISFSDKKADLLWLDDSLGALLKKLKENGQYDNTIIFFFNDHGIQAKSSVYEGGVWAPSIIWKNGGFPCGKRCDAMISNVDFAPTILDLANIAYKNESFDGKSVKPILMGTKEKIHDSVYFELGFSRGIVKDNFKYIALRYPEGAENWDEKTRMKVLIKDNKMKKEKGKPVFNFDPNVTFGHLNLVPGGRMPLENKVRQRYPHYSDKDQLYDLSVDPEEQNNLAANSEFTDKLNEMQAELKMYLQKVPGSFGELKQ